MRHQERDCGFRRCGEVEGSRDLSIVGLGTGTEAHLAGAEDSGSGGGVWGRLEKGGKTVVVFHGE